MSIIINTNREQQIQNKIFQMATLIEIMHVQHNNIKYVIGLSA